MERHSLVLVIACPVTLSVCWYYYYYYYRGTRKPSSYRNNLLDLIGNTPLVLIPSLSKETGCQIFAKCEYLNPCGSSKDRVAKQIIISALERGLLNKTNLVVEASSGSTGISLTRICQSLGLRSLIIVPNDQAQEKINLLRILGAEVELVHPASIVHPSHNVNVAKRRASELQGYFADQFDNDANGQAQLTTGAEIWQQTRGIMDAFVMSAGTGGTIRGVGEYLKNKNEAVRIVLADCQGSSLYHAVNDGVLYTSEQSERTIQRHRVDTICEGIGLDRMTHNFQKALSYIDEAIRVTDVEAVLMSQQLLKDGFFVGSSSAVNCVAAVKLAKALGPDHVIVTVFCSSGEREISKIHNPEFCRARGLL